MVESKKKAIGKSARKIREYAKDVENTLLDWLRKKPHDGVIGGRILGKHEESGIEF
jgi:hypothetical protein